jgi:hypothetical protein
MAEDHPFNPLDKTNLGISVADALLERRVIPLSGFNVRKSGDVIPFNGAGIYAIYYTGDFPTYAPIAKANSELISLPIYVGKAVPEGARKGTVDPEPGQALFKRIREHAASIRQAQRLSAQHKGNLQLKIEDFVCRYLLVDDIWIPLGESMMIERFRPIWNVMIDGFGNHDPGGGRYQQQRSAWDTVHPGRAWAMKCQPYARSAEQILGDLEAHLTV